MRYASIFGLKTATLRPLDAAHPLAWPTPLERLVTGPCTKSTPRGIRREPLLHLGSAEDYIQGQCRKARGEIAKQATTTSSCRRSHPQCRMHSMAVLKWIRLVSRTIINRDVDMLSSLAVSVAQPFKVLHCQNPLWHQDGPSLRSRAIAHYSQSC